MTCLSGCGFLAGAVLQNRRKLAVLLLLLILQGLFVIYSTMKTSPTAQCNGSNCPVPTVTILHPISTRLRDLLLGTTAAPPPRQSSPASQTSATAVWTEEARAKWRTLKPKNWEELASAVFDYIEKPYAKCGKSMRIGGQADYKNRKFDGYKWVCLDPALGLLQTNSCLIYSFGVDHDWSFDDNVQRLQCEIHAFDPSIGQKDHKRSEHISFHNLGIGGRDETIQVRGRRWDVRTYQSVVSMLGHQRRTVHYLKVDVEGAEWDMFTQIFTSSPQLLQNVRQIGMEIHLAYDPRDRNAGLDRWREYLAVFQRLEAMGFRLFHSEMNPYTGAEKLFPTVSRRGSRVYELVWLYQP
ncbi:methyltransferase-like protein 24 isoform X2 [Amphibalanus amphitrite]|uniref:methyltransferase-like protein 24 isoform X2 n=1 Tax=Amphibalanus amphitrite TaxID=1232801 RepID=UPI001C8FDBFD|nr:methyltransferase-like protein 24 isoform X2 [Amphibalanus amphitrite]